MRALNIKDEAAIREVYAPDARIWHNFDNKYQTIDENLRGIYWIHKRLSGIDYDVVSLGRGLPDGTCRSMCCAASSSGQDFAMAACVICKVKDGL